MTILGLAVNKGIVIPAQAGIQSSIDSISFCTIVLNAGLYTNMSSPT